MNPDTIAYPCCLRERRTASCESFNNVHNMRAEFDKWLERWERYTSLAVKVAQTLDMRDHVALHYRTAENVRVDLGERELTDAGAYYKQEWRKLHLRYLKYLRRCDMLRERAQFEFVQHWAETLVERDDDGNWASTFEPDWPYPTTFDELEE